MTVNEIESWTMLGGETDKLSTTISSDVSGRILLLYLVFLASVFRRRRNKLPSHKK